MTNQAQARIRRSRGVAGGAPGKKPAPNEETKRTLRVHRGYLLDEVRYLRHQVASHKQIIAARERELRRLQRALGKVNAKVSSIDKKLKGGR